jgi:hypothetical protein
MPFVHVAGIRRANGCSAVMGRIRTADVATIVDEKHRRAVMPRAEERQNSPSSACGVGRDRANGPLDTLIEASPPRRRAVLLYGGMLAIDGEVTVGTLVAQRTSSSCRRRSACSDSC